MDWQVDTVTELHKVTWMKTSFPSLVWNELCTEILLTKYKTHGRCVDAVAFEFSIKKLGKKVADARLPPGPKGDRLPSRKSLTWTSG